MIITRTPFRVSLFGGGTDYPGWFTQHGGAVLGLTINKFCYITLRQLPPFFAHKYRLAYSKVEQVRAVEDIEHPVVRAVLAERPIPCGLEIHHDGDLPARSGLGSSSSFTAGLLNALYAFEGRMVSKRKLALETLRLEQDVLREAVGSQDQIWACYGGLNRIDFRPDASFEVRPIVLQAGRRDALQDRIMLFFTGISRIASAVAKKKIENLPHRAEHLQKMRAMVDEAEAILTDPDRRIEEIGDLLHENWQLKRQLADGVSTPHIESIYQAARSAGALGGKILGAGGGGFVMLFVEPQHQEAVRAALVDLVYVPVKISYAGSEVVLYHPDFNGG